MNVRWPIAFGAAVSLHWFWSVGAQNPPETDASEPALQLRLHRGNSVSEVEIGTPFKIEVDGKPVELVLQQEPWKLFSKAGIRLRYPATFAFFAEDAAGRTSWILKGHRVEVVVTRFAKASNRTDALASTNRRRNSRICSRSCGHHSK